MQQVAVVPDTLQIDNAYDTLVTGAKGTKLFFEKSSFVLPDGSVPKGKVSIVLKECYGLADMMRENLSTTQNGQLLQTRGMVHVAAFAGEQELQLKKGKKFVIHFPKDTADRKQPMNLFYGQTGADGNINWQVDSATLLRPTAFLRNLMYTIWQECDSTWPETFSFKSKKDTSVFDYFYKHFDNTKLKAANDIINKTFDASFTLTKQGKITNIKVEEVVYDNKRNRQVLPTKPDPYFYEYISELPEIEPFWGMTRRSGAVPVEVGCNFHIEIGLYPPGYQDMESYRQAFYQKYTGSVDSTTTINSMNEAELNWYVFSASRLGWINCDYFWEAPGEKINYAVKVDPAAKPNVRLIFRQAKSIMAGTLEGDRYVFKEVPAGQDIKIVAISFKDSKPMLAISETRTGKQLFDQLKYKDFTIAELEKQLNVP
ncbi:hypothetical protein HB364_16095 [Pseudoflavitalea sp. X16]|uniref:hypothetical protein n=1 Tax=Paraflavitalea devenefica TaxID=2716334 RepID=UPI001421C813|nr:hypothetical protein [Paraflavitalea devenefica]NII26611.1 hypothetical protein [Paraflavitalea devenefica]